MEAGGPGAAATSPRGPGRRLPTAAGHREELKRASAAQRSAVANTCPRPEVSGGPRVYAGLGPLVFSGRPRSGASSLSRPGGAARTCWRVSPSRGPRGEVPTHGVTHPRHLCAPSKARPPAGWGEAGVSSGPGHRSPWRVTWSPRTPEGPEQRAGWHPGHGPRVCPKGAGARRLPWRVGGSVGGPVGGRAPLSPRKARGREDTETVTPGVHLRLGQRPPVEGRGPPAAQQVQAPDALSTAVRPTVHLQADRRTLRTCDFSSCASILNRKGIFEYDIA